MEGGNFYLMKFGTEKDIDHRQVIDLQVQDKKSIKIKV